jgi:hypothetical protein
VFGHPGGDYSIGIAVPFEYTGVTTLQRVYKTRVDKRLGRFEHVVMLGEWHMKWRAGCTCVR